MKLRTLKDFISNLELGISERETLFKFAARDTQIKGRIQGQKDVLKLLKQFCKREDERIGSKSPDTVIPPKDQRMKYFIEITEGCVNSFYAEFTKSGVKTPMVCGSGKTKTEAFKDLLEILMRDYYIFLDQDE